MADERLDKEVSLARRAVPAFGLARQQRVIWGVRRRLLPAKFSFRRWMPLVAAACLVGLVAAGASLWSKPAATEVAAHHSGHDERWELRDGSRVLIETPDTRITKQREVEDEVVFELAAGAARFDVAHRPERAFRVQAGAVRVEVIGTRFRVERQRERSLISVERGRVRVSWSNLSKDLSADERGVFPPVEEVVAASGPAPAIAQSEPASPLAPALPLNPLNPPSSASQPTAPSTPNAEALFASADRARAAGRPLEAAQALRELLQRFARDRRAPLAAFTLGRLLLDNLAQPQEAARAFAQARALSPRSSALAEDALAREAEALRAAGNVAAATKRAELYGQLYPQGARRSQVLRAAGLPTEP